MESQTTEKFRRLFSAAPSAVQAKARAAYQLWSANPAHPSLRFKKIHDQLPIYSVRIDLDWRAVGARFVRYADRMEVYGPDLGMPHTRTMGDGLFELRLKSAEEIARVFYCTVAGRQIVMLHQFVKKTEKTPLRQLAVARKRMNELDDRKDS